MATSIRTRLQQLLSGAGHWTEIRYHNRRSRSLGVRKGEVDEMNSKHYEGVGIRVLASGSWGFASTSDLSKDGLEKALRDAEQLAQALSVRKRQKIHLAATSQLAKGDFFVQGYDELFLMPLEEKFGFVRNAEEQLSKEANNIEAAICRYSEVFEDKIIMTSDGADCHIKLSRPEFRLIAFGADGSKHSKGMETVGATGNWDCLFRNKSIESFISGAAEEAVAMLKAPEGEGGKKTVILSPAMVGLLSHEAIGHTVEADFVKSGSVAAKTMNDMVASSMVTLCDSGHSEYTDGAGGELPVDDEGVLCQKTTIIQEGKLVSYLHNRESAAEYGVEPTGNARAWVFSDEPLIRMRNTYIEPGDDQLEDMIGGIENGYYIDGPGSGQADATGEFMFGASKVRQIHNGELGDYVQELTVSGKAFDVLRSVDAVSQDFKWDLGAGYCGKGQPAKVDAGGPYIRCQLLVGGSQQ
ncbi:MAG: TldD/PmbA family protein [SAR324 cluster bacterium]|nr:TldD/PmbA family protein [SAR324 cluster bacterium]